MGKVVRGAANLMILHWFKAIMLAAITTLGGFVVSDLRAFQRVEKTASDAWDLAREIPTLRTKIEQSTTEEETYRRGHELWGAAQVKAFDGHFERIERQLSRFEDKLDAALGITDTRKGKGTE